ncbi:TetR/AcrR family transcriptional regulator [Alloalcanivorax sp. C16-2]|uniref:TetR/AcrR family transcriptional regulator n=1 Tax=Alloalcanivorax sp. C16-2 TaxID=3390052 RepID=UPI003970F3C1
MERSHGKNATPGTRKAPANTLTRGHKKKARTRRQLLDAALRIYARAGVGGLALNTLDDGTLYNDFRSREQVLEAVGLELAVQLSEQILTVSEAEESGAERLSIAVRTFTNKARTDPDWTRVLITVIRYAEGMRSALATYLRADLQAGRRQGDFHYAHEEMALSMVISATLGAMNLLVEEGEVERADRIAAEMVLQALGVPPGDARRIAGLPLPGEGG